ncbi:MAG TPA: ribonuclease III [Syntrophomonas sp.]|jgi:ribonuclease-3|nr:ribonuclease III [Syntrophomonas sp.]HCF70972.1 ribonuclease III [Syntrophomonas sp.]
MRSEKNPANSFMQHIEISFNNQELMNMALTHPSYSQERSSSYNNQRMEFLGDAVLNFVVAEYLYNTFAHKAEGELTKIRARVVCENALNDVANLLKLGEYVRLGKGEEMSGGRQRKSILADTVEAVIGAIYLDLGMGPARNFILKYLEKIIIDTASGDYQDFKSRLQELVQSKSRKNVTYAIIEETGPAHAKDFVAGVYFNNHLLARGKGKSKKEAEQSAAASALKNPAIIEKIILEEE